MRRQWRRGKRALSAGFTIATCGALRVGLCLMFHGLQRRPLRDLAAECSTERASVVRIDLGLGALVTRPSGSSMKIA
jgi:hypothetical protein